MKGKLSLEIEGNFIEQDGSCDYSQLTKNVILVVGRFADVSAESTRHLSHSRRNGNTLLGPEIKEQFKPMVVSRAPSPKNVTVDVSKC